LARRAGALLVRFHDKEPLLQGMRREELRTRLMPRADIQLSDLILDRLNERGVLEAKEGLVALKGHQVELSEDEEKILQELEETFRKAGSSPPGLDEIRLSSGKRVSLDQLISLLINRGTLVRLTPQILMHADLVDRAWDTVKETIEKEGSITLADFRDKMETTRKFAIALLEYFDKLKRTRMSGDARVFQGKRES
ncbi:MAG TPA: hypothetical protein GX720_05565, partial [Clostridiaceae bacterium]|nr:hypothetical protein [Clostridiaceae bacterium]